MKAIKYYFTLFLLSFIILSCKNEAIDQSDLNEPMIEFIMDSLEVDLNKANNLPVLAVVFSEVGLKQIDMYFVNKQGEEFYKTVDTFFDNKKFSLREVISYDSNVKGFKIVATDKLDRAFTKILDISTIPYQMPPTITFNFQEISIDERKNDPIPETKFTIKSSSSTFLDQVTVYLFSSSGSTLLLSENFEGLNDSIFQFSDSIPYKDGDRSLQVTAIDRYNKKTINSLPIKYSAVPPPIITNLNNDVIIADVEESKDISFSVSSEIGVSEIIVLKCNSKGETQIDRIEYTAEKNLNFNTNITFDEQISSVKFLISDKKGRTSELVIPAVIGFNYIENYTIGGQYYIRGFEEEPETKNIFSFKRMQTVTIKEAYDNVSDADFHIYMYYGASGTDNGIRLNAWGQITSPTQLGEIEFSDLLNGVPLVNTWPNRNRTFFLQLTSAHGFNFDNATVKDLKDFVPTINKDRLTKVPLGESYLVKTAASSSVGSKIGIMKVESIDIPETVPYPHSFGSNYSTKKCARVRVSIKFPK